MAAVSTPTLAARNEATIDVHAFVGGVEITVPGEWDVQVDISANFAGIVDERDDTGSRPSGAPRLIIKGTATVGGVSVKNG